jgi:hypothetical protein
MMCAVRQSQFPGIKIKTLGTQGRYRSSLEELDKAAIRKITLHAQRNIVYKM